MRRRWLENHWAWGTWINATRLSRTIERSSRDWLAALQKRTRRRHVRRKGSAIATKRERKGEREKSKMFRKWSFSKEGEIASVVRRGGGQLRLPPFIHDETEIRHKGAIDRESILALASHSSSLSVSLSLSLASHVPFPCSLAGTHTRRHTLVNSLFRRGLASARRKFKIREYIEHQHVLVTP